MYNALIFHGSVRSFNISTIVYDARFIKVIARPNILSLTGRLKRTLTIVLGGSDSIAESKAVYQ